MVDPALEVCARAIAFYLPQFYPTPENDRWWGAGFTEWTNVASATPLFEGHYQPHIPADVGFYDLRVPEVRALQSELAQAHGIEAFCYWHYWFEGRRLLSRPFDEVLMSGAPAIPFCLGWANETWTRRWHGAGHDNEILIHQGYSAQDDIDHGRWLARAFADPRYVRVDGQPLFLIYRPYDLPDPRRTLDSLREQSVLAGTGEPLFVGMNAHHPTRDARAAGFDLTLNFEPQLSELGEAAASGPRIYDYETAVSSMRSHARNYPTVPCVMVGWDNTPRRGRDGIVFRDASPLVFESRLARVVDALQDHPPAERLVFLNAWNEWAEGNHLEPDLRYGSAWLGAVRNALSASSEPA